MNNMDSLKQYYTTVYAVTYSSCGYYLAAASNYGAIAIFNLTPLLELDEREDLENSQKHPVFKFIAHEGPVYSLVSTKQFLVSGGIGELKLWKWSEVKKKEAKPPVWTFSIPQGSSLTKPEVNSMVLSEKEEDGILYAGCGDNKVYCIDICSQTLLLVLEGHSDYIHCVDIGNTSQECASASEDGTVRLWDARKDGNAAHVLEPYKHDDLNLKHGILDNPQIIALSMANRPEIGKWVGCVAFDASDDWLVCGGAPNLCMWHIKSLAPSTQFPKSDATANVVLFHEDVIVSGGSEPCLNHWSFDGKLQIEVPTSASSVFSIGINSTPTQEVLAAGGSSYKIDVCTDFRYKDFSLYFSDK